MNVLFVVISVILAVFTYGFVDPNLHLSGNPLYAALHGPLMELVFRHRPAATAVYAVCICVLFLVYYFSFRKTDTSVGKHPRFRLLFLVGIIYVIAYPAFSYDIFNYVLSAKVAFFYHENPWIVMPVAIPNEPMLAFTRAANKVTLYGPTWVFLTAIPWFLGRGTVWAELILFKSLSFIWYLGALRLIYRITKDPKAVLFFGMNPLVLIEVLLSGHNDIVMMVFSLFAVSTIASGKRSTRYAGIGSFVLSVFVKGATVVLLPLWFLRNPTREVLFRWAYILMFVIFLLSPIREEMYPWYAVWFLVFAAVIPIRKGSFIHPFSIVLTFSLLLRYIPYMLTFSYGGPGPIMRELLTAVPVLFYLVWYAVHLRFRPETRRKALA
ncbi:hypothetical protein M1555_00425 [Patescibacteria group bacterium]|nr:hypothetical protein [Patescibacteria group bacterium]